MVYDVVRILTRKDNDHHVYILLWHRKSICVGDFFCSMADFLPFSAIFRWFELCRKIQHDLLPPMLVCLFFVMREKLKERETYNGVRVWTLGETRKASLLKGACGSYYLPIGHVVQQTIVYLYHFVEPPKHYLDHHLIQLTKNHALVQVDLYRYRVGRKHEMDE